MGEFRTLVLAKVLSVRDSSCLYPSCAHCYCKLHLHTDSNRYECMRCHAVYTGTDIKYRYCLNLTIADDETLCDVAVFGTCLEPFLGISANGLKSFLDEHLKTSKASTLNDPDSLLHKALQNSLVGLMFLFGFKVNCERSRSQRERHSPVRIRNILEKSCQQRNWHHGKLPQLVAHQMVHANRDTPFVSVLDLLKQILKTYTEDNKVREGSREFGVPRNTLPSRKSVSNSDISWCSSSSSRASFGQSMSRVSLGQQSLVLSCDESGSESLISSSMSDDLQSEPMEKTDSIAHHSSQDETYFEENLESESYRWQANDYRQNDVSDIVGMEGRMEKRTCSETTYGEIREDVDVPDEKHEGRQAVIQEHPDTSRCENMSAQFLEGAFDETCWEGELPGNLCQKGKQKDHLSGIGDGAMGGSACKEPAAMAGEICYASTNQDASDETSGASDLDVSYNLQHAEKEPSRLCEHDVTTSTEEEVLHENSGFDESVNDSYLLLAELNDHDTASFAHFDDQNHDVCRRDGNPTHQHSSSSDDIQHHVTKTSCDDLPYSEGLDTFIDQLDQPMQYRPERICQTGNYKVMADSNAEDQNSKHDENMVQQEREISDASRSCTNLSEDNGLNMKQKQSANVEHVGDEEREMQAMWQEDFPYSEDLDAFLAEMDENITVESERKEEADVSKIKEPVQQPIENEVVFSVETNIDIHPCRTETGSTCGMEGSRGNLSFLHTDKKGVNTDKKGRTKSLFEQLVRRKTLVALDIEETSQTAEVLTKGKGTEKKESRKDTGEIDSESDSTSHDRDKIVSDSDSVLSVTSSVKQSSVERSDSAVSIPDSEKSQKSSGKLPAGKSMVQSQSQDSMENAVFTTALVENHDFSILFDDSFGHLSDTESPDSCRNSCGDAGGMNELPDTPAPPSRAASLARPSRTSTRSFNLVHTEMAPVTNNGKTTAATRMPAERNGACSTQIECSSLQRPFSNNLKKIAATRMPAACNGANPTQTECSTSHSANSDCDSPDSSPNELADTPHDSRCKSFLSVRGMLSFNSTTDDGKCSDSAYSSSHTHLLPSDERKNISAEEPKQETQRRKSVHFSSHLESVHEISKLTGTEEVFDDYSVSKSVLKTLPTVSQYALPRKPACYKYRKSPLQSIDNYGSDVQYERTPELYSQRLMSDKKTVNSVARTQTPMSNEGTPNFFSQVSPMSADRRQVRGGRSTRKKSVGTDSTPNFFSQFSPQDSDSEGIIPGTEDRPCRRRVSCMLKNVIRYPADDTYQGTPDMFETSLHGGSESGDLGASPDLFGDSPIPDSPANVRHTGVMSLCKRLFHRQ
ncbi:serine-rich adhesin for platelets-like [Branchiostoma lanceolatum]|uniref:serine-rich adhesin for platelets-like n=1 Tax=Branchiostoma lanceolatum TaxID=7740 RepID=UPI003453F11D